MRLGLGGGRRHADRLEWRERPGEAHNALRRAPDRELQLRDPITVRGRAPGLPRHASRPRIHLRPRVRVELAAKLNSTLTLINNFPLARSHCRYRSLVISD